MRLLLIHPSNNMEELLGEGKVFVHSTEPLGILYIASVLEENGFDVEVLDAFVLNMRLDEVKRYIRKGRWEVIGISCLTSSGAFAYHLGKWIKEEFPEIYVIMGNIHASVYASFFLEQRCADVIVHGEGEYIMPEVLTALKEVRKFDWIKGISWWDGRKVIYNGLAQMINELDTLPLPARHLVPMEQYTSRDFNTRIKKGAYRVMFTSRGCVFQCTFCVVHQERGYRMRSPAKVVDEIELLVRNYNASFIEFLDPLFTVNKKRVADICNLIKERRIDVEWQCEAHVNTVDRNLLETMKSAGCVNVAYGLESGVQELLDRIGKKTDLEKIRKAVNLTSEVGIHTHGLFMIGLPGETREMTQQTINFAKSLPLEFGQFAITVPYPGSQLYYDLVKKNVLDQEETPDEKVRNWIRYSAYVSFTKNTPIYVPEGRTGEELKALQKKAIRSFYLRPRNIIKEIKKFKFRNWKEYLTGIKGLFFKD